MGVSENLKRGVTEIVLLALLSQQDMYGYEMAQAMRERSHEKFTLLETSMYPTLYRLQDNGYISAREELVGQTPQAYLLPSGTRRAGIFPKNLCGVYDSSAGRTGNSDQLSGRGDRYCTV